MTTLEIMRVSTDYTENLTYLLLLLKQFYLLCGPPSSSDHFICALRCAYTANINLEQNFELEQDELTGCGSDSILWKITL